MSTQSTEETLNFIEDYKTLVCLWDATNKNYINKQMRKDATEELANKYTLTHEGVKKKIKSLRSYFSKEHSKVIKKTSGSGAEDIYVSGCFAYKSLFFIKDSVTPKQTKESGLDTPIVSPIHEISPLSPTISDSGTVVHFTRPQNTSRNIKKKKSPATEDPQVEEAYGFMKQAAHALTTKDESSIFGEMVAVKVRKLTPRNRAIAQNKINNFLFKLEMEEMKDLSSSHLSTHNSNSLAPLSPVVSVTSVGSSTLESPDSQPLLWYIAKDNVNQTQSNSEETVNDYNELFQTIQRDENNERKDDCVL